MVSEIKLDESLLAVLYKRGEETKSRTHTKDTAQAESDWVAPASDMVFSRN